MTNVKVPRDAYVNVMGTDLVRLPDGQFVVLEDNLRVPSGVSYMLSEPEGHEADLPGAVPEVRRPPDRAVQPAAAVDAALAGAGRPERSDDRAADARASTTRPTTSTPILARQMGIELVEGRDLVVHDNVVYMRTTNGLQRVDVIYRRVDDDFLDPLAFRVDSALGAPGAVQRLPRRQRDARQRARHRRRRRQGDLRLRAADHPLLPRSGSDPRERRDASDDRRTARAKRSPTTSASTWSRRSGSRAATAC